MDDRRVFEGIQTATVLKPGDRVLLTVDARVWTETHLDFARQVLGEKFPGVEFAWISDVESVTILPAGEVDDAA